MRFGQSLDKNTSRPLSRRFADKPRPFLKWAGSKQALLNQIIPNLPINYDRYFEPFLGGGALFLYEKPSHAKISDQSSDLVGVWCALRDDVEGVIHHLAELHPSRQKYYEIREERSADPIKYAAEFVYLNHTCWNGLYRVNSKGKFNVPFGKPKTGFIFDEENLRLCAKLLQQKEITIANCDFRESVSDANNNDFVYFDPPYVTKHNNNGFRDWNETLFSWSDQVALSAEAKRLAGIGVSVIVSNADHEDIVELYPDFAVKRFERSSTLSSNAKFRGKVGEVLLFANCGSFS
ncbi:MAG: Dam family site-specific DNA-(adenine-N6)-methyltransferase [Pseudomonadota bacterium]